MMELKTVERMAASTGDESVEWMAGHLVVSMVDLKAV